MVESNTAPTTSIVIVTYNSHQLIRDCVQSIQAHTQGSHEIVIVDNASWDDTRTYLQGLKGLKVILNAENRGYSAAANQGIELCTGEFVTLLNPDTLVTRGWNRRMMAHFKPGVGAVGPVSNFVAGRQKVSNYLDIDSTAPLDIEQTAAQCASRNSGRSVSTKLLIGFCMMISRQALERAGHLDGNLFLGNDDLDYCHRLRLNGFEMRVATDTFIYHKGQASFNTVAESKTRHLVQDSTDFLYYKLMRHYGIDRVPTASQLWGMDWFNPQVAFQESLPLTSIVVLTFNQLAYTRKCVESIFRHTGSPFELIMVDNGSSDGTRDYLAGLSRAGTACVRIHIIANKENVGFAGGCNQGLAEARGEHYVLLNNDVIVTDGWLRRLLIPLLENPRLGLAGPMTNRISGPQQVEAPGYDAKQAEGLTSFAAAHAERHGGALQPCWRLVGFCLLIRGEVVQKIGGLDTRYNLGNFEDDDFCFRAHLAGFEAVIVRGCFVHHFGGRTFEGNGIDFNVQTARNWKLFKEKWDIRHDMSDSHRYQIRKPAGGFDPTRHFCALPSAGANSPIATANALLTANIDSDPGSAATKTILNSQNRQTPTGGICMSILDQVFEVVQRSIARTDKPVAIWILERLFQAGYTDPRAHHQLGMLCYETSHLDLAQTHLAQAVRMQPDSADYAKDLGDFYHVVRSDIPKALDCYEKAAAGMPENRELLLTIGHLHVSQQDFEKALSYYQQVRDLNPDDEEARTYIEKVAARCRNQSPTVNVDELYEHACNIAAQGDAKGAIEALEQLLAMDSQHAAAHNDLGVLCYESGDKDKAQVHYETAVRLDPHKGVFQKNLADLYYVERGEIEKALACYVQALTVDPEDVESLMNVGQICMRLHQLDDARIFFNRVLDIEPWHRDAAALMAQVDQVPQSVPNTAAPVDIQQLYDSSQEKVSRGDTQGAIADLQKILTFEPGHAPALNDLGVLHYELGDKQEALRYYEKCIEVAPDIPVYLKNLADFYYVEQSRIEDALRIYVNLLEKDPEDVDCLSAAGAICAELGRTDDARLFFEKVLVSEPWHPLARRELDRMENAPHQQFGENIAAFGRKIAM